MLKDVCKELLEDVWNGWEYRELEFEETTEDGTYYCHTLKYEREVLIYWYYVIDSEGGCHHGGAIVADGKDKILSMTPDYMIKLINEILFYYYL